MSLAYWRLMGVPSSYEELRVEYAKDIRQVGHPEEVIAELKRTRFIERFRWEKRTPSLLASEEAASFLGMTTEQFSAFTRSKNDLAPRKVSSGYYVGLDVLHLFKGLSSWNFRPAHAPKCPSITRVFSRTLERQLQKFKGRKGYKPDVPITWPIGLPKNYEELFSSYGNYIFTQIRWASRIQTADELSELTQEVWAKLMSADILRRFAEAANAALPPTLTLSEVLAYLGIDENRWHSIRNRPRPIQDGTYLSTEIQNLDAMMLNVPRPLVRSRPPATLRGFKSYLSQAIRNHFKNVLRTRSRRHKERGLDATTGIGQDASGICFRTGVTLEADSGAWEERLADQKSLGPDDFLDLVAQIRQSGIDVHSPKGLFVLDALARGFSLETAMGMQERRSL